MKGATRPLDTRNRREIVITGQVKYNGTADLDVVRGRGIAGAETGGAGDLVIVLDAPYPVFLHGTYTLMVAGGGGLGWTVMPGLPASYDMIPTDGGGSRIGIQLVDGTGATVDPIADSILSFSLHLQQVVGEP